MFLVRIFFVQPVNSIFEFSLLTFYVIGEIISLLANKSKQRSCFEIKSYFKIKSIPNLDVRSECLDNE